MPAPTTSPTGLCHYTNLATLVSILEQGELTLGDTARWEDRNDAASVEAYRRKTGAAQIRVLSFAAGDEQIHLWLAYARKDYGGCIRFNTPALLAALGHIPGLVHGPMRYTPRQELTAGELAAAAPKDLPFIKRRPLRSRTGIPRPLVRRPGRNAPRYPPAGLVDGITLAPGLAAPFGPALTEMLEARYAARCALKVRHSRLLSSPDWIRLFDRLG